MHYNIRQTKRCPIIMSIRSLFDPISQDKKIFVVTNLQNKSPADSCIFISTDNHLSQRPFIYQVRCLRPPSNNNHTKAWPLCGTHSTNIFLQCAPGIHTISKCLKYKLIQVRRQFDWQFLQSFTCRFQRLKLQDLVSMYEYTQGP